MGRLKIDYNKRLITSTMFTIGDVYCIKNEVLLFIKQLQKTLFAFFGMLHTNKGHYKGRKVMKGHASLIFKLKKTAQYLKL